MTVRPMNAKALGHDWFFIWWHSISGARPRQDPKSNPQRNRTRSVDAASRCRSRADTSVVRPAASDARQVAHGAGDRGLELFRPLRADHDARALSRLDENAL